ncbi:MAG: type 1 glutamine amidotransferase [Chloroflexi bacterium]|nr:type 1 glutamine amidotransferase [Chloroflexota bacterium]
MDDNRRVALLVERDYDDSEFKEIVRAMNDAGVKVVVVGGGTQKSYRGRRRRSRAHVDMAAVDARAGEFDAVIIPGGYAPDWMRLCQPMVDLVRRADALGKVIAAICHGPQLMVSAGIVKGRRVTSWPSIAVDMTNAGAEWRDEAVVQDGNMITSRKPADLPRFNRAILRALGAFGQGGTPRADGLHQQSQAGLGMSLVSVGE